MNELVRQLAIQSMANVRFWNAEEESYEVGHDELVEFARLIVRECAAYAFSDDQDRKAMLKDFGVEE